MKHSIRFKVTLVLVLMALILVTSILILNSTMLEKYYMDRKQNTFINTYDEINELSARRTQDNITEDEYADLLEKISSRTNIAILIVSPDWSTTYASMGNLEEFRERLQNSLFRKRVVGGNIRDSYVTVVEEKDDYTIQKVYNEHMNDTFVELYGILTGGNMVYMSLAIKSIQDNVSISNRFIWQVGIILIILSFLVSIGFGNYLTRPILEIVKLAQNMTRLEFDTKYEGEDKGEIGILGNSMNQLSAKLESTITELKQANIELTKDIEDKEAAEERRKEFLSDVSHELKTPIALIQGYAEGLKEAVNDDAESREFYCDVIMEEAFKMNEMVKKLLTLSHIESGSEQISIEHFDITELISGIVTAKSILAQQQGIDVIYKVSEPMYVWADEIKIEEVIVNYFTNAVNHCREVAEAAEGVKDKKIIITNEKIGDKVKVTVFNTGNNIPEEELDKIWIKFYKVDKARTREYGGNGIGLSIVKAIMELHGEKCGVNNRPDGVEFYIELDAKA